MNGEPRDVCEYVITSNDVNALQTVSERARQDQGGNHLLHLLSTTFIFQEGVMWET
jgi:hypothetical protein